MLHGPKMFIVQEGETVELRVIREQGKLLNQLVRYTVIPSGNTQFYGATGILEFQPGEREVMVALVAKPDGIPEVRTLIWSILFFLKRWSITFKLFNHLIFH